MAKYLRYSFLVLGIGLFCLGRLTDQLTLAFWACVVILGAELIFCLEKIKERIFLFFFCLTIFLFLMGRPFIQSIRGIEWIRFSEEATWFAVTALAVTLLCLLIGAFLADTFQNRRHSTNEASYISIHNERNRVFLQHMQSITLLLYLVSIASSLMVGIDMLVYMHGRSYLDYYTSYSPNVPYIIQAISHMAVYCLAFFLATMPSKRKAFIPLALYFLSAVPSLVIGQRNPIVLHGLFIFLYYFIRDYLSKTKENEHNPNRWDKKKRLRTQQWLGRLERGCLVICIPFALLFLSLFNYTRMGDELSNTNVSGLLGDFLYHQGVSFDVLCIGYETTPLLPSGFHNYTFGSFIDYFTHGAPARLLFGARPLESGNTLDMALNSNSYTHAMSYAARGQEYLDGHGWGSSYLLETYTDFGWVGVVVFSVILGFILHYAIVWLKKNWFTASLVLIGLTGIFFIPRSAATEWMSFIFTAQFLLPLLVCWLYTLLWKKRSRSVYTDHPDINSETMNMSNKLKGCYTDV